MEDEEEDDKKELGLEPARSELASGDNSDQDPASKFTTSDPQVEAAAVGERVEIHEVKIGTKMKDMGPFEVARIDTDTLKAAIKMEANLDGVSMPEETSNLLHFSRIVLKMRKALVRAIRSTHEMDKNNAWSEVKLFLDQMGEYSDEVPAV